MEKQEFFIKMKQRAEAINLKLEENVLEKFYKYAEMILEWNEKTNLTRILDLDEMITKHFIDSLTIYELVKGKSVIDVGTGAGFPGIPLKIVDNNEKMLLLDSLNKRILFLNETINQLELNNIEVIHSRAEDAGTDKKYREKFDVATSRAVAPLNVLVEYLLPFVKVGGKCICMKGPEIEEELNLSKNAIRKLGGEIEKIEKFQLPFSDNTRTIIIISKKEKTKKEYPRKAGIPSKKPL